MSASVHAGIQTPPWADTPPPGQTHPPPGQTPPLPADGTDPTGMHSCYYRPQRSCGQGYVFTGVCDSVHRGGLWRTPPGPRRTPSPGTKENPPDQVDTPRTKENPPGPRRTPRPGRPPQDQGEPPPGKKTAAYGQ